MLDNCNIFDTNIFDNLKIPISFIMFDKFNILILIIFLIILKYLIEKLLIFLKIEYILNYNLLTGTTWDDN